MVSTMCDTQKVQNDFKKCSEHIKMKLKDSEKRKINKFSVLALKRQKRLKQYLNVSRLKSEVQ